MKKKISNKFNRLITIQSGTEKKRDHAIVLAERETLDKEKQQYKYLLNYLSGVNNTMHLIDGKDEFKILSVQIIEQHKYIEIITNLLTNTNT